MKRIPKAKVREKREISPNNISSPVLEKDKKIVFSFEAIDKNEYFNLDGTCQNWSMDLFDTLKKVSNIYVKDVYAGKYSGKTSTLRIHQHDKAVPPCKVPNNVALEDMWQIRISLSKGGVHGIFSDNIFYIIWFDPHHNLYPDKNHGGLKRIIPPSTCCKDRDYEIERLKNELKITKKECQFWERFSQEEIDKINR